MTFRRIAELNKGDMFRLYTKDGPKWVVFHSHSPAAYPEHHPENQSCLVNYHYPGEPETLQGSITHSLSMAYQGTFVETQGIPDKITSNNESEEVMETNATACQIKNLQEGDVFEVYVNDVLKQVVFESLRPYPADHPDKDSCLVYFHYLWPKETLHGKNATRYRTMSHNGFVTVRGKASEPSPTSSPVDNVHGSTTPLEQAIIERLVQHLEIDGSWSPKKFTPVHIDETDENTSLRLVKRLQEGDVFRLPFGSFSWMWCAHVAKSAENDACLVKYYPVAPGTGHSQGPALYWLCKHETAVVIRTDKQEDEPTKTEMQRLMEQQPELSKTRKLSLKEIQEGDIVWGGFYGWRVVTLTAIFHKTVPSKNGGTVGTLPFEILAEFDPQKTLRENILGRDRAVQFVSIADESEACFDTYPWR